MPTVVGNTGKKVTFVQIGTPNAFTVSIVGNGAEVLTLQSAGTEMKFNVMASRKMIWWDGSSVRGWNSTTKKEEKILENLNFNYSFSLDEEKIKEHNSKYFAKLNINLIHSIKGKIYP